MTIFRTFDAAGVGFDMTPGVSIFGPSSTEEILISDVYIGGGYYLAEYEIYGSQSADYGFILYYLDGSGQVVFEKIESWLNGQITLSISGAAVTQLNLIQSGRDAFLFGSDQIIGNSFSDLVYSLSGNDTVYGMAGDDQIYSGIGSDLLFGGGGNDFLYGEAGNDSLYGDAGNDGISGGSGNDLLFGQDGNDQLDGEIGNDSLYGGAGDDRLYGWAGNDLIDGDVGNDTAGYLGNQTSYTLVRSPNSTAITDRRYAGDGTDQLVNMEFLDFNTNILGTPFSLNSYSGTTRLSGSSLESFIELYIAYFNRAPDALGLNFWGTAYANGMSLEEIATRFIDQDETRATYPSTMTNTDFATAVYNNVLGRVPDQDGFNFWVKVLDEGSLGRDKFILSVLGGAKTQPGADASAAFIAQQLADRAYLENKIDIGAYFSVHKGMSDVNEANYVMSLFDGTDAGVSNAVNAINIFHQNALDPDNGDFLMPIIGILNDPFTL